MKYFDFHSFAHHCEDFLAVLDTNFQFVEVNSVWCGFLQLPEEAIVGTGILKHVFHEDLKSFKAFMDGLPIGGFKSNQHLRLLSHGNAFIYTQFSVRKIQSGFELLLRDVTKETEDAKVVQKAAQLGDLGAWSHDPVANKSYWNDVVYRIYDLEQDAPMDHAMVVNMYHPDDKERMLRVIDALYANGQKYDEVTRIVTPKNNLKWIRVVAEPIVNNSRILWISGFVQDITQRQKVHEKILQSEEQKYLALKGIKSGIFDHDLVNNKIVFSPDFVNMLGFSNNSELESLNDFIHSEDLVAAKARFRKGIRQPGHYYENHFRLRDVKGLYRYYEVYAWRKKDSTSRKTVRMIGNVLDVHDKVLAEQKQRGYLNQLEALLNNGFVNSVLLDTNGRVLMADKETRRIGVLEYGSDAVDGHAYFGDILPADERKRFEAELPVVLNGNTVRKEVQHIYVDGRIGWLEVIYKPVKNKEGDVTGIIISFVDIAEKKMAEIEKHYNQSRLEELHRMKGNIISNLSHEIRTPLNGVLSVAEMLPDAVGTDELEKLLDIQIKSANRLLKTIDDIIRLSKVAAEKSNLELESVDIAELLKGCYEKMENQVKRKGLLFNLKNFKGPTFVMADSLMLEQSLINVISNAVKFTKEGGIVIKCVLQKEVVQVQVQDTGIGISLENQERIFSDFEQESLGHSRAYEGSGVGLSFTKKFLELMGGQIDVVSIKSEGSIFTITMPMLK